MSAIGEANCSPDSDRHLRELKASKTLPGFDEIRLPGQQRLARRTDRMAHGVPVFAEVGRSSIRWRRS